MARELILDAGIDRLAEAHAFLAEALDDAGCLGENRLKLELSLEEAFVNIANHAYPGEAGKVRLRSWLSGGHFFLELADGGIPFNPLEVPPPSLDLPLESRRIGGLGIHMIRESMDGVGYERREGRNILTLDKKLA
ncbi:MAG: ATP-binding protein [Planctomycetota bacterium]|nr:ATP-binding protein [Planctomycetota bacterium]